jgi:hypothetical protein
MPRKKSEPKELKTLYIPTRILKEIEKEAEKESRTLNWKAVDILSAWYDLKIALDKRMAKK